MDRGVGPAVDREVTLQLHLHSTVEGALHLVGRVFGLEVGLRGGGVDDGEVLKLGVVGDKALELTIYAMSARVGVNATMLAYPSGPIVPFADCALQVERQRRSE